MLQLPHIHLREAWYLRGNRGGGRAVELWGPDAARTLVAYVCGSNGSAGYQHTIYDHLSRS